MAGLPSDTASCVNSRREVFFAGGQGPDLLFYVFGKFRGYGSKVHACATYEQFFSLAELCRKTGSEDLLAYTLGYLTHYAVDRALHPYVIHTACSYLPRFFAEDLRPSLHMKLESAVDKILFLRDNGNGAKFRARDWLPYNDASRKAFCEATAEIAKIFGTQLPYDKLYAAQKRMSLYQSVFDSKLNPARLVVAGAGALIGKPDYIYGFLTPPLDTGIDYMNAERRPYPSITDDASSPVLDLSVDAILENAHKDALALCAKFAAAADGVAPLCPSDFEICFTGRRSVSPEEYVRRAGD